MPQMLIFGLGYTAARLSDHLRAQGWTIEATGSEGTLDFCDDHAIATMIRRASHILSSVPPDGASGEDPVLVRYGSAIQAASLEWTGYLSSTGVYGDAGGAWVDENTPVGRGRRAARTEADLGWQGLRGDVCVFRLPGIYGPGRSALDRVPQGRAHRIDLPNQIFSRVHVDDIVSGVIASFAGRPGVYNLADDLPCHQNRVVEAACDLLGREPPPLQSMDEAGLSPAARAFYAENRRVANGKAKRLLGWTPRYPTYREGLRACLGMLSPPSTKARPTP